MNSVLEALKFRHACKKFDPERNIPKDQLEEILECARISPSSFGMEGWKFLVIQNRELRQSLREVCWNQPQLTDASEVVVILVTPNALKPDSEHVKAQFQRYNMPEDAMRSSLERYRRHCETEVDPLMSYYAWGSKQCYIALSNIMTAAAAVGIDSCPIEGFSKKNVDSVLELDTDSYEVAVIVTLGYRAGEQRPPVRVDSSEVIEYRV